MTYRLLAFDLDGTLLNHEKRVSPATRQAIEAAIDRGCHIVLATGRGFGVARYFSDGITLNAPQITFNGAVIYDPLAQRELSRLLVPADYVLPAIEFLLDAKTHVAVFTTDHLYVTEDLPDAAAWLPGPNGAPVPLSDIRAVATRPCIKVVGHSDALTIAALRPVAMERFGHALYVTETSPVLLELLHPEVSKGAALRRIAHMLRISRHDVIAFGDSHNDLDMLEFAGVGVAMGNASPEVMAIADLVTRSNEDDGIASALQNLGVI